MYRSVRGKTATRFSLLLLEEGEYYFGDYGAELVRVPPEVSLQDAHAFAQQHLPRLRRHEGRLKIGSASLFFEPSNDTRAPIERFAFGSTSLRPFHVAVKDGIQEFLRLETSQSLKMKRNGRDHPYEEMQQKQTLLIRLPFADLGAVLEQLLELHELTSLHGKKRRLALRKLVRLCVCMYFREKPLFPSALHVSRVSPLVEERGLLMLTDKRLYFQSFTSVGVNVVRRFELAKLRAVHRRSMEAQNLALELLFSERPVEDGDEPALLHHEDMEHLFVKFNSQDTREQVRKLMLTQEAVNLSQLPTLESAQKAWCEVGV
ncbi:MAG: hypothetical protein MHM6MM_008301 [Cercozoa sp. M6MM]